MFPKPNRLPASEIRSVLRSKSRISSKEFQLIFQKNTLPASRFAVIVSNKIDKRATARNRMKRLVRESIRHLLPQLATPVDYIVFIRSNISDKTQKEVEIALRTLISGAQLRTL